MLYALDSTVLDAALMMYDKLVESCSQWQPVPLHALLNHYPNHGGVPQGT